eukprot:CAMPEP_0182846024 /NCGR_PEP_ID=MMETSP0006_2-20121128/27662_1 /TAXON_ID=97485 /ORGANISM="Prymnesium parvum, Strain Texoma1" /LENGTH=248 /DNA_ID=CAMNT_0024976179 /DNA_START=190 /DNA_END=938 /DNA_ORIENTATION=-
MGEEMGLVVDRVASAANREEARAGVAAKELALQVQGVGKKAMAAVAWPAIHVRVEVEVAVTGINDEKGWCARQSAYTDVDASIATVTVKGATLSGPPWVELSDDAADTIAGSERNEHSPVAGCRQLVIPDERYQGWHLMDQRGVRCAVTINLEQDGGGGDGGEHGGGGGDGEGGGSDGGGFGTGDGGGGEGEGGGGMGGGGGGGDGDGGGGDGNGGGGAGDGGGGIGGGGEGGGAEGDWYTTMAVIFE